MSSRVIAGQAKAGESGWPATTVSRAASSAWPCLRKVARYWRPIYNLLEDAFTVLVVNAQHSKAVPGRKTDVADSEWIADPLRAMACCRPASSRPGRNASCAS